MNSIIDVLDSENPENGRRAFNELCSLVTADFEEKSGNAESNY